MSTPVFFVFYFMCASLCYTFTPERFATGWISIFNNRRFLCKTTDDNKNDDIS